MGEPSLDARSHVAVICPSPSVSCGVPGAPGRTSGVIPPEVGDSSEYPTSLRAATVNRYSVPLVSPSKVQLVDAHVWVAPPGCAVTRYPVMGAPLAFGASHATVTALLEGLDTRGVRGASGTLRTVRLMVASVTRLGSL